MNDLQKLQSMGLVMPTPAYIAGAIVFGIIGWVAYRRGRKMARPALTCAGVALMIYPYAVPQTWLMWCIGIALVGWVFWKWD